MNNYIQINGMPGFGSSGKTGDPGLSGLSFHVIDSSVDINSLRNFIINNNFSNNDLFYFNNDLYIILDINNGVNKSVTYKKICNNPSKKVFDIDNNLNIKYDYLISDNIKTKREINDLDIESKLTIINNGNLDYIKFINKDDNFSNFIKFDKKFNAFSIGESEINIEESEKPYYITNILYTNTESNILTEQNCISELHKLVSSIKINENNNTFSFNYKLKNGMYKVTKNIKASDNNDSSYIEILEKDFNPDDDNLDDNNYEYEIENENDIFFKIYYLDDDNNVTHSIYSPNIKFSKLLNVGVYEYYNDGESFNEKVSQKFGIIINKNVIILQANNNNIFENADLIYKLKFQFDKNSNINVNNNNCDFDKYEQNDNDKTVIVEFSEYKSYNITIGNNIYKIIINEYKEIKDDPILNVSLDEDKNGYLGCNSNNHGVPGSGILQVYSLNFNSFDDVSTYNISFDIESGITEQINDNNLTSYDCSLYCKLIKTNVLDNYILDNDTYVTLNLLNDSSVHDISLIENKTINYSVILDRSNLSLYSDTDNTSSYKLVIYYDFDEPYYGILHTKINTKINSESYNIKTIEKRTLMIPWEIIGFAPTKMNSATDFNLSIKNIIKRDKGGITPKNFSTLQIEPESTNILMAMNTFDWYNYFGGESDESFDIFYPTNSNINLIQNIKNMYANNAFLTIAYNRPNNVKNISYYTEYGKISDSSNINFAQCEIKYPVWVKTSFNININNDIYKYDSSIIPQTNSLYSPKSADDFMVDLHLVNNGKKYTKYTNHMKNNTFVGFVEWSLNKNTHFVDKDNNTTTIYTQKIPFTSKNELYNFDNGLNLKGKTLYSMYWKINPRVIQSTESEILYDCAINMLKHPKVYINDNKVEKYYVNPEAEFLFNSMIYNRPDIVKTKFEYEDPDDNFNDDVVFRERYDKLYEEENKNIPSALK